MSSPWIAGHDVSCPYGCTTTSDRVGEFLLKMPGLETIRQPDPRDGKQQTDYNARGHVGRGAQPLAVLEHFCGFPAEAGESGVATEKADGNGDAPVGGNHQAIESKLADESEQKAAGKIDEQGAVGKGACSAKLNDALQGIAGQGANRSEERNQYETQSCFDPPQIMAERAPRAARNKKLPAPLGSQESSVPVAFTGTVMANSIAFPI